MSTMKFKCTLLTDVILNQKSASEGSRKTLDFIPGNNFLGIVASELYKERIDKKKALILFHTGDVKFGDAHPSNKGVRGLKIPAVMFYPKLKQMAEECYIHYLVPDLSCERIKHKQLKQCRSGFYCFSSSEKKAEEVRVEQSFAIKSAYDKQRRRSKDEMMYGYESLEKGSEFYFEICFNDQSEQYKEDVKNCLVKGNKRIGRSRTAQYGLVKIEEFDYEQVGSDSRQKENLVTVYADGRLIFLDKFGIPTFRPTAADLGVDKGTICWDKSQIRTFQYAPWNYKRQAYDADRCGIEKGSVFVVEISEKKSLSTVGYVGSYQNEGFGKVIYNPEFFLADAEGKAMYQFTEPASGDENDELDKPDALKVNSSLLKYLRGRRDEESLINDVYINVNQFVNEYSSLYRGDDSFAAQWGTIRKIAMKYKGEDIKTEIKNYLENGVASDKWNRKSRKEILLCFIETCEMDRLQKEIVNLAAEMAKVCE